MTFLSFKCSFGQTDKQEFQAVVIEQKTKKLHVDIFFTLFLFLFI